MWESVTNANLVKTEKSIEGKEQCKEKIVINVFLKVFKI